MPGCPDPAHERVTLTSAERDAFDDLDLSFGKRAYDGGRDPRTRFRSRREVRLASVRRAWFRWAPWLTILGAVVMVAAVAVSLLVSVVGAFVAGIGLASCLLRPRARRRRRR